MTGKRALFFIILIGWQVSPLVSGAAGLLASEDVPLRMERVDDERRASMPDYTYMRRYVLDNARFRQHAEMVVRVTASHASGKQVEVISSTGSDTVRKRVFQKMLEAERSVGKEEMAARARINPRNYDFAFASMETRDGQNCYVLQMKPKGKRKFLLDGQV
ncbi:MAG: hypothetical protein NTY38_29995, partial [Acidobacteria bacterium]|nr:hypothetical protein [Acidobacteriota bacterium]